MAKERIKQAINMNADILLGAGPDTLSGMFATDASKNFHSVAYFTYPGDGTKLDKNTFALDTRMLEDADPYLIRANKYIHRQWPTGKTSIDNSLRRDSYLVRYCQRVYAIGTFTDDASLLKISGELAWPCQMYVDRFLYDKEPMDTCELYIFDTKGESWFLWRGKLSRIDVAPKPCGIYAVIGTNKLTRAAREAIDHLWY